MPRQELRQPSSAPQHPAIQLGQERVGERKDGHATHCVLRMDLRSRILLCQINTRGGNTDGKRSEDEKGSMH